MSTTIEREEGLGARIYVPGMLAELDCEFKLCNF